MTEASAAVDRIPAETWRELRAWMLLNDADAAQILEWSTGGVGAPATPEAMAFEIVWIILCAGRSAQAARTIEARVSKALRAGTPVVEAFGYRAKAEAIEKAWTERVALFEDLGPTLASGNATALVDWCGSLAFVGDDTKFQLAKNFGVDVCKPDVWLSRLAGFPDRPRRGVRVRFPACQALCEGLARSTGDRVAAVDSLLWLACNKGILKVGPDAGPVTFVPRVITARSIYELQGDGA